MYKIIETRKLSGLLPTAFEHLRKTLTPVTSQLGRQSDQGKLHQKEEKGGDAQMLGIDLIYICCKSHFKCMRSVWKKSSHC